MSNSHWVIDESSRKALEAQGYRLEYRQKRHGQWWYLMSRHPICGTCGEEVEGAANQDEATERCCGSDDFPEPGDIRETGK